MIRSPYRSVISSLTVLFLCFPVWGAEDSSLTPIDSVPRLAESFKTIDYRDALADGTLLPDRISRDTLSIRVGSPESELLSSMADSATIVTPAVYRTREEQWQFIASILAQNNFSMHYYILSHIYYDQQLYGWFKSYEWEVSGVGTLRACLHAEHETDKYHIWLLELTLDPVQRDRLRYDDGPALMLIRSGDPGVRWNINTNTVVIESTK